MMENDSGGPRGTHIFLTPRDDLKMKSNKMISQDHFLGADPDDLMKWKVIIIRE